MSYIYTYLSNVGIVDPALSWCCGLLFIGTILLFLRAFSNLWK